MDPGTDETAGVHWGGRQPSAGTDNGNGNRGHLGLEGVTMAPAPPTRREPGRTEDDSQQETGDSVRPSSQRVGGQAPLRPACRRCSCPMQERCKKQDSTTRKNGQKQTRPRNTRARDRRKKPRTPNRETATRPNQKTRDKNTPPGFRAKTKHRKSQNNKSPTGRGLEVELDEEERIEPRDCGHQPLGQKETPRPPGTAGVSFCPEPAKVETEKRAKRS